jgi:uncharacterized protein YndB with AHSA1/START domain
VKLVERRVFIDDQPARVYELLTDAEHLATWMAPLVHAEPRPGGELTWTHHNGDTVAGAYVELVPDRRVVFTYGWQRADVGVPPGSTTVTIDLRPRCGGTELHLVHRGLSGPMAEAHAGGWANYLGRLAAVAEGREPGPDPLADERVPAADPETLFWACASPLLAAAGVTRSTMMGFACLRLHGEFFASFDHRSGALVVKLDEAQVDELLATGRAEPFAPNGRRFKAWAAVPSAAAERWDEVLDDALAAAIDRRDRGDRPSPSRRR